MLESAILSAIAGTVYPPVITCPSRETTSPGLHTSGISRTSGGYVVNLMVLATVVFAYGLASRRLEGTVLTAPIIFVVAGIGLGPAGLGLVEEAPMLGGRDQIEAVVALTVLLSVLLHGVTAAPLSAAYARRVDAMSKDVAEKRLYHSDAGGSPLRQRGGSSRSHGRPNG